MELFCFSKFFSLLLRREKNFEKQKKQVKTKESKIF
jgi:hypothetical protein